MTYKIQEALDPNNWIKFFVNYKRSVAIFDKKWSKKCVSNFITPLIGSDTEDTCMTALESTENISYDDVYNNLWDRFTL